MKLTYPAALTLLGWYLIVPPANLVDLTNGGIVWKQRVPLSEWMIQEGYDRASEWTEEKGKLFRSAAGSKNLDSRTRAALMAAQCIATDDPLLTK
jgi:hypothetical protein